MPLHPDTLKLATDWIKQHCPNFHCAACGNKGWEVDNLMVAFVIPDYAKDQTAHLDVGPGAKSFAVTLPVTCVKCRATPVPFLRSRWASCRRTSRRRRRRWAQGSEYGVRPSAASAALSTIAAP